MNADPGLRTRGEVRWGLAVFGFAMLLAYAGLYPFTGWTTRGVNLLAFILTPGVSGRAPWSDMVANVLAYIPFGLFLVRWRRDRARRLDAIVIPALIGASLSFGIEYSQQFLPGRVASLTDLLANTLGTVIGASLAGVVHGESLTWTMAMRRRNQWFRPGRLADLGLIVIGLWTLSQLAPLVPSLDLGNIRQGLSPAWQTLQHPDRFSFMQWATYALYIAGLALLALTLAAPGKRVFGRFFVFVACVLLAKILIMTRQLSLEAVTGALAALGLALQFVRLPLEKTARVSASFIVCGFAVAELASDSAGMTTPFHWIPFASAMEHPLIGLEAIIDVSWPAASLAYLARFASPPDQQRLVRMRGALLLALLVFGLEWYQQHLPGRVGDITTVLLTTGTWMLFWWIPVTDAGVDTSEVDGAGPTPSGNRGRM